MDKLEASGRGEMVDAQGLGPCGRKVMGVRVPSSALFKISLKLNEKA